MEYTLQNTIIALCFFLFGILFFIKNRRELKEVDPDAKDLSSWIDRNRARAGVIMYPFIIIIGIIYFIGYFIKLLFG